MCLSDWSCSLNSLEVNKLIRYIWHFTDQSFMVNAITLHSSGAGLIGNVPERENSCEHKWDHPRRPWMQHYTTSDFISEYSSALPVSTDILSSVTELWEGAVHKPMDMAANSNSLLHILPSCPADLLMSAYITFFLPCAWWFSQLDFPPIMYIASVPFAALLPHAVASKQHVQLLSYNTLQIQYSTIQFAWLRSYSGSARCYSRVYSNS